ncbi:MAG: hypothetical protein JNK97_05575, partial [Zoogloea sp.]|nr:hypothetical protein [Zoogloea sp.]
FVDLVHLMVIDAGQRKQTKQGCADKKLQAVGDSHHGFPKKLPEGALRMARALSQPSGRSGLGTEHSDLPGKTAVIRRT